MAASEHERMRHLFHQAVTLPAGDQQSFLEQQCGDDVPMLQAVRRLLQHHLPDAPLLEVEETDSRSQPEHPPAKKLSPAGTKQFGETMAVGLSGTGAGVLKRSSRILLQGSREKRVAMTATIVVVCLLVVIGNRVHHSMRTAVAASLERTMQALLDEQVFAIRTWLSAESRLIETWARSPDVVAAVAALQHVAGDNEDIHEALAGSESSGQLRSAMNTVTGQSDACQFAVWNREGTLLADSAPEHAEFLGNGTTEHGASLLSRVYQGKTVLWLPTAAGFITSNFQLQGPIRKPGIALITPVYDQQSKPIAAMLISSVRLQAALEELLQKARFGDTGEAYAFSEDGYLITESRFMNQLQSIGLVDEHPEAYSAQVVRVADPGGNLVDGYQTDPDPRVWPLTTAAASAVSGVSGGDFSGYRDYRGVTVVGVWTWMPEFRFGIAAEVDFDHAYSPLTPLRNAFAVVLAALCAATAVGICAWVAVVRDQRQAEIGRIGPYTLRSLLGEGGFAHVYLASHAMLKRPTAVKVLKPEQINSKNLARFEREVQLASSLTHPNTIGIYDYGSTDDGRFYYSMEYIKGLSLNELVSLDGPQPPERIVWILSQVCRSLREAHLKGLIHRDIKPQNIMLCQRGGEDDTVKVLDFGLARNLDSSDGKRVTETQLLIGTPLYIAPERILDPTCMDPRSDVYSLGILGYYLLTGREPFDASDSMAALAQTVNRTARRPSEEAPHHIPDSLDRLIRDCHSRAITDRPDSADVVLQLLEEVPFDDPWSASRAAAWWNQHRPSVTGNNEDAASVRSERTTATIVRPT